MSLPAGAQEVKAEALGATWEKRFFQRHYTYRDYHSAALGANPAAAAATYIFGTNTRLISTWNWPHADDPYIMGPPKKTCLAREVKVLSTENCLIRFISLNPLYIGLASLGYSAEQLVKLNVPQYITETPMLLLADDEVTFYPTYGYAINFYQPIAGQGTLYIWIEGNVEGGE